MSFYLCQRRRSSPKKPLLFLLFGEVVIPGAQLYEKEDSRARRSLTTKTTDGGLALHQYGFPTRMMLVYQLEVSESAKRLADVVHLSAISSSGNDSHLWSTSDPSPLFLHHHLHTCLQHVSHRHPF